MLSKLWFRFVIIGMIMAFCGLILAILPLKKAIDLEGGVDLLFELDKSSIKDPNANFKEITNNLMNVMRKRIDPNGLKNLTWRVVGDDRIEIQMPLAKPETEAAREKFRDALKELDASNIQPTQLDLALSETGAARDAALDKIAPKGSEQRPVIDGLAKAYDSWQALKAQGEKEFKATGAISGDLAERLNNAKDAYELALKQALATNVEVAHTVTKLMTDMEDPNNAIAKKKFEEYRSRPEFATRRALFQKVMDAHLNLVINSSGGFDDPEELKRQLQGRGVLEFRIAVKPNDESFMPGNVIEAVNQLRTVGPRKTRVADMAWFEVDTENAPEIARIADYPDRSSDSEVVVKYEGTPYILLYTDSARSLDHSDKFQPWSLTSASVGREGSDPIVFFGFDAMGGSYFARLTTTNVHRPMAIVLDDKVISAPNINSPIPNGSGTITMNNREKTPAQIQEEAEKLVALLRAGSLPASLKPSPISEQKISSTLGADNITKGLSSSVYAILAVAAFMIVYYSLTGGFANIAVIVNLVMLMAAMAALQASLTLPGIAGIVLTLGMAVDSNVLINERIREEVQRGASLWMAVRQGYDKVFWTIFDAHITTSLTSVVLIFIDKIGQVTGMGSGGGANEVKGFGVTLLIGLMCSMFTALFVTRTLMVASVKWGVLRQIDSTDPLHWIQDIVTLQFLKGKWPFLKMLTVANIDWMGKKYYFWIISFTITVLGMCAFFYRGSDKYDTEFNGGTQVTMNLSVQNAGDKLPDISQVRHMVNDDLPKHLEEIEAKVRNNALLAKNDEERKPILARAESLKLMVGEAQQANVLEMGEHHDTFQVVSTVSSSSKDDFVAALADIFRRYMPIQPALQFTDSNVADPTHPDPGQVAASYEGAIRHVTGRKLDDLLPGDKDKLELLPDVQMRDVSQFVNGAAIVLDNIQPAQSSKAIEERIQTVRKTTSGGFAFRNFKFVPVAFADNDTKKPWEDRLVTKAVILISDPNLTFNDGQDWLNNVVLPEWRIVKDTLTKPSTITGSVVSFDAAVADAAKVQALIAMSISLCLVVAYVWIRFGSIKYGIGAILSLAHDALMAVSATVLAGLVFTHFPRVAGALLLTDFKINLTMIAAYLTIVGYSVNDTIVIFDRIRENRGRGMAPMTVKLVNDSINQCFGRTIWTTFTVFIVVLILYIWGGEGVRGFSFAMLIGVITGAYSTLAIASPALLSVKELRHHAEQPPAEDTALAVQPVKPAP